MGLSQRLTDVKRLSSIAELPGRVGAVQKKTATGYAPDAANVFVAFG
jgi:hypothetical protein